MKEYYHPKYSGKCGKASCEIELKSEECKTHSKESKCCWERSVQTDTACFFLYSGNNLGSEGNYKNTIYTCHENILPDHRGVLNILWFTKEFFSQHFIDSRKKGNYINKTISNLEKALISIEGLDREVCL